MLKRIHQVFTFLDSPTKFPYNRSINAELHSAIIEYENGKAKPGHYFIRLTDLGDPDDQRQEWFLKRLEVVTDPTLARVIGFFNIYNKMRESIEPRKIPMHCKKTTFLYHEKFSTYMKVDGATSEDIFDYLFEMGVKKIY